MTLNKWLATAATATVAALATLTIGVAASSAASAPTPTALSGVTLVTPERIADTGSPLGAGGTLTVAVAGHNGVPSGATGAVLSVTDEYSGSGANYLSIYPSGTNEAGQVSQVSVSAGQTVTDEVTVALGADGNAVVFSHLAGSHVLVDLLGYTGALPTKPQASATTAMSNRDDSGDGGNWALDTITRTASVSLKAPASVSNCGAGATTCYLYEGTIADTGSFVSVTGAKTPADGGKTINGTVMGSLTGGSAVEFYASSNSPTAAVPATTSGDSPSTTDWVKQFFAPGTTFSTPQLLNWSWTYLAPNTCEKWVDALAGQTGNIAGVNACS